MKKKWLYLLLALFLGFACQNNNQQVNDIDQGKSDEQVAITATSKPYKGEGKLIEFEGGFRAVIKELSIKSKEPVYEVVVEYIQWLHPTQPQLLKAFNEEQEKEARKKWKHFSDYYAENAGTDKVEGEDTYFLTAMPTLFNDTLISFYHSPHEWIATQRRSEFTQAFNFLYPPIKPFELKDYFNNKPNYLSQLSKDAIAAYQKEQEGYLDEIEIDLEGMAAVEGNYDIFFFTKKGLIIFFPAYQIGIGTTTGQDGRTVLLEW